MFLERRAVGKVDKYYVVHSYREKGKVRKIRKYVGHAVDRQRIAAAEKQIALELCASGAEIFRFSLTHEQVARLNRQERKIRLVHLQDPAWKRFTERFTYDTNAIEGSSVRKEDVSSILMKKKAESKDEIETKGVARAVSFIRKTKQDLSLDLIRYLHELCFRGSKGFAGEFREVEVIIKDGKGGIIHAGTPVSELHSALDDLVGWYYRNKKRFRPLVLAAIVHNQFEHIHPFQDGNGRIGRLLLNFILIRNRHPPINISLEDRAEYYRSLQEYSRRNDIRPTLRLLVRQYRKTLRQVTTKQES